MKTSVGRDGTLKTQPNQIGTAHATHSYILCHFANNALCLLVVRIAGLWKAVGRVLLGVQCMFMCVESVYVVGRCILSMAGRVCLVCRNCEHARSAGSVWYVGSFKSYVVKNFIAAECSRIWLWIVFMWKTVEWTVLQDRVHLVSV